MAVLTPFKVSNKVLTSLTAWQHAYTLWVGANTLAAGDPECRTDWDREIARARTELDCAAYALHKAIEQATR